MATWKRLTLLNSANVDVNMDLVMHIQQTLTSPATLFFAGGESVQVTEKPDEIHMSKPLRSY